MNKSIKAMAATGLVAMSMSLVACQQPAAPAPKEDPAEVLQKGISKLMDVKSNAYSMNLKGDLKDPSNMKVTFDFSLNGANDLKDPKSPKLNLSLKGEAMAGKDGGNLEAAVRLNKDALYLSLISLNGKGELASIPEEVKSQLGKWWTIPVPPEVLEELAKAASMSESSAGLTEEQKKIRSLVEQAKLFKDINYKGSENVGGEPSHHYTANLDKDAFVTLATEAAKLQGKEFTQADIDQFKTALNMFDFSGDFYVGQNSGVLNKVKGNFVLKASEAGSPVPSGQISFEYTISNIDKPVTVEVPANAQAVPLEMLGSILQ